MRTIFNEHNLSMMSMMATIIPKGKKRVITDYDLVQFQPVVMITIKKTKSSFNDDEEEMKSIKCTFTFELARVMPTVTQLGDCFVFLLIPNSINIEFLY